MPRARTGGQSEEAEFSVTAWQVLRYLVCPRAPSVSQTMVLSEGWAVRFVRRRRETSRWASDRGGRHVARPPHPRSLQEQGSSACIIDLPSLLYSSRDPSPAPPWSCRCFLSPQHMSNETTFSLLALPTRKALDEGWSGTAAGQDAGPNRATIACPLVPPAHLDAAQKLPYSQGAPRSPIAGWHRGRSIVLVDDRTRGPRDPR